MIWEERINRIINLDKVEMAPDSGQCICYVNEILPKEMLLRIMSYLDVLSLCRCAQVSQQWNALARDGLLWRRLDLFPYRSRLSMVPTEFIMQHCGALLIKLCLSDSHGTDDASMKLVAEACPNLLDLNLGRCVGVTDLTCLALAQHCHYLQRLILYSCKAITDVSLQALAEGCSLLRHLNVSLCELISGTGLAALARGCPGLRTLICKCCPLLLGSTMESLIINCPALEELDLEGSQTAPVELKSKLRGSVRLLGLSNCPWLSDAWLCALAASYPELRTVYLRLSGLSAGSLTALVMFCPHITTVNLAVCDWLTDAGVEVLVNGLASLSDLNLLLCPQVTDAGIAALARRGKKIKRLVLAWCELITDATLVHLAEGCPALQELDLFECGLITDYGVEKLSASHCAAHHLTNLRLSRCGLITDLTLRHIRSFRRLQHLDLYECPLLSTLAVCDLMWSQPDLLVVGYHNSEGAELFRQYISDSSFRENQL